MWYVYIIRSISFPDQEYTRCNRGFEAADSRPQRRQVHAHGKIQALETDLVLRFSGQVQSAGIREISQIPFRPRICEKAVLMIYVAHDIQAAHAR